MATTTPKLGLNKPIVGADDDAWGGMWNTNADKIDVLAPLDSPVFIGTPSLPAGTIAVTAAPGDADTSVATTAFVAAAMGAVPGGATIAATPPALNPGALWWDTIGGQLYVRYNDGSSTQWTAATTLQGQAGVATTQYVDTAVSTAQRNVGRNLIHNALFTVAQRGAGPFSVQGFTLDRWNLLVASDTVSVAQSLILDGGRAAIGDEEAAFYLGNIFTGNAAAGASNRIQQGIENVRRLAGKTVILSFWAVAAAGTPKLGINMVQNFGSGGSPSASVQVLATGIAITLSTTWTRYSATITVPSIGGKTLGTTAGTDFTVLQIFYSSGATSNQVAGNIGVQSGAVNIWGVQLEIAAAGQVAPTPLEKMDAQQTLAVCQRFYYTGLAFFGSYQLAGVNVNNLVAFPVTMRGTPIITLGTPIYTNTTVLSTSPFPGHMAMWINATATGNTSVNCAFTASADL